LDDVVSVGCGGLGWFWSKDAIFEEAVNVDDVFVQREEKTWAKSMEEGEEVRL
jgi:hypothetical protein